MDFEHWAWDHGTLSLPRAFCWIFTVSEIWDAKLINLMPVNELFFSQNATEGGLGLVPHRFYDKGFLSMTLNCEIESIFGVLII